MTSNSRSVLLAFSLVLGLYLAYILRKPLLLIYVSVVFAVVLSPAVNWMQRLRIGSWQPRRGLSILSIFGGVILLLLAVISFAIPPIVRDIQDMTRSWPEIQQKIISRLDELPFGQDLNIQTVERHVLSLIGPVTGFVQDAVVVLFSFVTVLVLVAYLILDGRSAFEWIMRLIPPQNRSRLRPALEHGAARMRRWIIGQGLLMLILGSSAAITLSLLGVKYSFVLGFLTGVTNIIPVAGPLIAFVLVSLVALIDSLGKLLGVAIFFLVYQQVENAFLTPRIMQSQVQLSPVAVLIAIILGGGLAGIPGALVAVPTAAMVSVLCEDYLMNGDAAENEKSKTR